MSVSKEGLLATLGRKSRGIYVPVVLSSKIVFAFTQSLWNQQTKCLRRGDTLWSLQQITALSQSFARMLSVRRKGGLLDFEAGYSPELLSCWLWWLLPELGCLQNCCPWVVSIPVLCSRGPWGFYSHRQLGGFIQLFLEITSCGCYKDYLKECGYKNGGRTLSEVSESAHL